MQETVSSLRRRPGLCRGQQLSDPPHATRLSYRRDVSQVGGSLPTKEIPDQEDAAAGLLYQRGDGSYCLEEMTWRRADGSLRRSPTSMRARTRHTTSRSVPWMTTRTSCSRLRCGSRFSSLIGMRTSVHSKLGS